jgi:D-xylose transport system permease protein
MNQPADKTFFTREVGEVKTENTFSRLKIPTTALRAYTMLIALAVIWIYFQWSTNGIFLNPINLSKLMQQMAVTGVLAVGMLMVIVAGQIDLSVGSVLGLAGGVSALALLKFGLVPAFLSAIVICIVIGLINGALVAYANIPAFIVTLGGLLAWRGAIKGISHGETVGIDSPVYKAVGEQYIMAQVGWGIAAIAIILVVWSAIVGFRARQSHGLDQTGMVSLIPKILVPVFAIVAFVFVMNRYKGIPIPVIIFLVIALIGTFITQKTTFGRYLYAIGGNPDAARLSGINIRRHIIAVYALLGALTGIAAIMYAARLNSAAPDAGVLKELDAIAACVIGGASLAGGRGAIFGACLGALIMGTLDNGMSLMNVRDFMQDIIKGSILVAAVGLDIIGRKRG